jgi:predicted TIM-barrel fold metal-dependent hydrolase
VPLTDGDRERPLVVDAHHHVGHLAHVLSFDGRPPTDDPDVADDAARRVATMDALGIGWAVLQPSHGYLRADGLRDTMKLNDRMAEYRSVAPDRFRVLGTTEPLHGGRGVDELDRFPELGLDGVAWHHRFQGCYVDSAWMWPILRRVSELRLVPLVHVNAESSLEAHWRLQRLALDFPELTFLAMDGFWTYERARNILMTAAQTPNVVWDLGGPVCYVSVREWIDRNGSTTLCFSAGGSYSGTAGAAKPPLLAQLEQLAIGDDDRANILGGNVARAFSGRPR